MMLLSHGDMNNFMVNLHGWGDANRHAWQVHHARQLPIKQWGHLCGNKLQGSPFASCH